MFKHKNLFLFILMTFAWSVFVSMLKFFLRWYLEPYAISLEEIVWYIALWSMISYFIWWFLAYLFRKKDLLTFSTLAAIIVLSIGQLLHYYPFVVFVIIMGAIGLIYGMRTIIKSILLSTEMQKLEFGESSINGIVNIAILWWIILWSYFWFLIYGNRWEQWFRVLMINLIVILLASYGLSYDTDFQKKDMKETLRTAFPSIRWIIKKYIWLLVPIWALWAISLAVGQKMLELWIDIFNKMPKSSIIIIIISMLGAIVGHIISAYCRKHKRWLSMIFTILFGFSTLYFPYIISRYDYYLTLTISSFLMGVFFGVAVNLLEWRFFFHIGEDHRKEYGSAAYGIATNIIVFAIMISADLLTSRIGITIPFVFFGIVLLIMPFFIRKFR